MTRAFVFGKFLPFHKGHEAMIQFALSKADFLTVLICCSDQEVIPDRSRRAWIETTFKEQKNLEVITFNYLESEMPNTSASSLEVSAIWANLFKQLLPDCSLLITSEPYGDFVATYMNIRHIAFDIPKRLFPVSATALGNDVFAHWRYVPDCVKPTLSIKVVLLGTESTGKTTLAQRIAQHFHCGCVLEAARDLIADSNSFSYNDLGRVAIEHARRIDIAVLADHPLVVIDTDIHTTQAYSRFTFEKELEVSDDIYASNKASLYLYLNHDVEHIQDGTRLDEIERNRLDLSMRKVLAEHLIDFVEIMGSWEERFENAVQQINMLLKGLRRDFRKS